MPLKEFERSKPQSLAVLVSVLDTGGALLA